MRWGLIGTTGWADHTFCGALQRAGAEVVGGVGSNGESSRAFAARHNLFSSYGDVGELLADDAIEAVWIASPSNLHADHVLASIDSGKHVLIEKPMTRTTQEAVDVTKAASAGSVLVGVGYQHRFNPAHQALAGLIRKDDLGKVAFARLQFFVTYPEPPSPWRRSLDLSGGWAINDLGTHLIDLASYLIGGRPRLLGSRLSSPKFDLETDDLAVVLLGINDATVVVEVSTGMGQGASQIEVNGLEGRATLVDSWTGAGVLEALEQRTEFERVDNHVLQVRAFEAGVEDGTWLGATVKDGAAAVAVVTAATE